jgi:hypothetical protein
VIIVVEGPTACGKTTWATRHAGDSLVAEAIPTTDPPRDARTAARFWAEHGATRWEVALDTEQRAGVAVCDTDPLKLHYSWSLWRMGLVSEVEFRHQADAYRELVSEGRIGFADAYFVSVPAPETLERRRSGDTTRLRRNFSIHAQLGEPLREWYTALEELRPGSVRWSFPGVGLGSPADMRRPRYELADYDGLIRRMEVRAVRPEGEGSPGRTDGSNRDTNAS